MLLTVGARKSQSRRRSFWLSEPFLRPQVDKSQSPPAVFCFYFSLLAGSMAENRQIPVKKKFPNRGVEPYLEGVFDARCVENADLLNGWFIQV